MKSIGRLLLLGAALALLAPTSSWADYTDTGSRHGIRRHDRTHHRADHRADHRRTRPLRRPSVYAGYSHHGGVYVRFSYGYRDGRNYRHHAYPYSGHYYRRHHRRHDYDRHYYNGHYHGSHH